MPRLRIYNKVATSVSLLKSLLLEKELKIPNEIELGELSVLEQIKLLAQHLGKVHNSGNILGLADILTSNRY